MVPPNLVHYANSVSMGKYTEHAPSGIILILKVWPNFLELNRNFNSFGNT